MTRHAATRRTATPHTTRSTQFSLRMASAAAAALAFSSGAYAKIGLDELIARIGIENIPTGKGVAVAQVEAQNANGNYRPSFNNAEFADKTFTLMSGSSSVLAHATNVGLRMYGLETSVSPAIDQIYCYSAQGWLAADLLNSGALPSTPPKEAVPEVRIYNNSWIGSGGTDAMRRADFLVLRDNVMMISGVANSGSQASMLAGLFNGISVGRSSGGHAMGDTGFGTDVPGRMKPELVAPDNQNLTSYTTGLASSAAALLVQTARTPPLDANPNAERSEVLKAVMLGGAKRSSTWTNNPAEDGPTRGLTIRPLDEEFGAGEANVNTSHLMLTGNQFMSKAAPPPSAHICRAGWDLTPIGPLQSRYWRFRMTQPSQTVSVVATWHRQISPNNMSAWSIANIDLRLWRVDSDGSLQPLVGPAGESFFNAGNVASASLVDNVELLYIHGLAAGEYVIEIQRLDLTGEADVAVAWLMDNAVRKGDINGSGTIGVPDLLLLLGLWGPCPGGLPGCLGDLTCSGNVGVADLLLMLSEWGG